MFSKSIFHTKRLVTRKDILVIEKKLDDLTINCIILLTGPYLQYIIHMIR